MMSDVHLVAVPARSINAAVPSATDFTKKWLALLMLMVQSLVFGLCFRYATIQPGKKFSNLSVMLLSETLKLVASLIGVCLAEKDGLLSSVKKMAQKRRQTLFMGVPGIAFGVQNFFFFAGQSNLSVAMYQVSKQVAIPLTAVMSFIILRQKQTLEKMIALCLVVVGVCLSTIQGDIVLKGDSSYGILCVMAACSCSGFASAFTEAMLKNCAFSIWERNVQLSGFGCMFAILGILSKEPEMLISTKFFEGYSWAVAAVVAAQVLGGLFTAAALKYADSVSKCVVKSSVVILGMVLSRWVFNEGPSFSSVSFVSGGALVIYGSVWYTFGSTNMFPCFSSRSTTSSEADTKVADVESIGVGKIDPDSETDGKRDRAFDVSKEISSYTDLPGTRLVRTLWSNAFSRRKPD